MPDNLPLDLKDSDQSDLEILKPVIIQGITTWQGALDLEREKIEFAREQSRLAHDRFERTFRSKDMQMYSTLVMRFLALVSFLVLMFYLVLFKGDYALAMAMVTPIVLLALGVPFGWFPSRSQSSRDSE